MTIPRVKPTRSQVAAIPTRWSFQGTLQVLLVTSRETRRWVIPKGWPWSDLADHLAAAEEAWEEAGVRGQVRERSIGKFTYEKRRDNKIIPIEVAVYVLAVTEISETWPEAHERKRAWFEIPDAADAITEPDLREIILTLRASPNGQRQSLVGL